MKFDEEPNYSTLIPLFGTLVWPNSSISPFYIHGAQKVRFRHHILHWRIQAKSTFTIYIHLAYVVLFCERIDPTGRAEACQVDHVKKKIQHIVVSQIARDQKGLFLLHIYRLRSFPCSCSMFVTILYFLAYIVPHEWAPRVDLNSKRKKYMVFRGLAISLVAWSWQRKRCLLIQPSYRNVI